MSLVLKYALLVIIGAILGWAIASVQYSQPHSQIEIHDATESSIKSTLLANHNLQSKTDAENCNQLMLKSPAPPALNKANKPQQIKTPDNLQRIEIMFDPEDYSPVSDLQYWQSKLYQGDNLEDKLTAIDELTLLNKPEELATGLGDPSIKIRKATVEGLQQIGDSNSIRLLAQSLYSEPNANQRINVIYALASLSYDPLAEQFIRLSMQKDPSIEVRRIAAQVLNEKVE
jgi:HEAT repeat protein